MSTATETIERSQARQGLTSMIRRVKIRNYKSIENCDVELKPFTVLVGRNGAGKSNLLDAIRFVTEGLREPELQVSGKLSPWRSVADNGPRHFGEARISLEIDLDSGAIAEYLVVLGLFDLGPNQTVAETDYGVVEESLSVRGAGEVKAHYRCVQGEIKETNIGFMPPAVRGLLYLGRASVVPEFRPVYEALTSSAFYDLVPQAMRKPEVESPRRFLARDGSNLASAYGSLTINEPVRDRLLAYLSLIVPEFSDVEHVQHGPFPLLIFNRAASERSASMAPFAHDGPKSFYVLGISDGTLRVLAILVAINQLASDGRPIRLVGIEEPETALHPAAAGALMDAFRDAASHTQVLVTTHGADLLDRFDPEEDHILAVEYRDGRTEIGPVNPASRDAIREHLFSAGELLRMDQLHPDRLDVARQAGVDSAGPDGRS